MTLAALGIEAKTDGVKPSTDELNALTVAAGKTEVATDNLAPAARRAGDSAKKLGADAKTAEGSLARLAGGLGTVVGQLAAMASAALSVGAYIRLADTWSDLRSQLGAAIGDMGAAGDMMNRLKEIADASYSPLDQTVQVYARNVGVLRDLGKSAAQAADFTESLNHMLVITATKGERATSVQNALSEAMAVGKLQAEGLETILANGGRVAEALAAELGTTVSGLRGLASEGKITGQVIADSIIKPLNDVRAVAGEMPATVGDAFTRIGTGLLALVGNFDQATGASGALASSLIWFADNLPMIAESLVYLGTIVLGLAATQIPAMIASLVASIATFGAAATAAGLMATATTALGTAMTFLGGPIGIVVGAIVALGAAIFVTNARTEEYGGASKEMLAALQKVPGYADGAAGGIGRAGGAASSAAGQFDTLTGAIDASTSAMSAWLTERAKIPGMLPIENGGILGGALPDAGGIEDFLLEPIIVPGSRLPGRAGRAPPRAPALLGETGGGGGRGGGGGGGGTSGALQGLINELSTERELLTVWYEEKLALINSFSELELEAVGGRHGALERLEAEHQERLRALGTGFDQERLQSIGSAFGDLASLMQSGNNKLFKIGQAAAIAEATVSGYGAAVSAWEKGMKIGGPPVAAAFTAASLAKTGMLIAKIGSSGKGGGGGGSTSAANTPQQSAPETPLRVTLDTIDPSAAYSGSAMIKMFEAIQKEAGNRGIVWVPAGA